MRLGIAGNARALAKPVFRKFGFLLMNAKLLLSSRHKTAIF
jgi:hypothetical protein